MIPLIFEPREGKRKRKKKWETGKNTRPFGEIRIYLFFCHMTCSCPRTFYADDLRCLAGRYLTRAEEGVLPLGGKTSISAPFFSPLCHLCCSAVTAGYLLTRPFNPTDLVQHHPSRLSISHCPGPRLHLFNSGPHLPESSSEYPSFNSLHITHCTFTAPRGDGGQPPGDQTEAVC